MSEFDSVEGVLKEFSDALRTAREKISGGQTAETKDEVKKPVQGRLDIDDAEQKNREANKKSSIQDLRDLREGKIDNKELKERVRARGGMGGAAAGDFMPKSGLNKKPTFKSGGKVKSASTRADGCAIRGKTRA